MIPVKKGKTNVSVEIRILNASTGLPETGVNAASSGLDLKYRREGAAAVSITEVNLSALTDAHSDGGLIHIGTGYYRLDVPDAAFVSGASSVIFFGQCTGMVIIGCRRDLVNYDPEAAVTTITYPNLDETNVLTLMQGDDAYAEDNRGLEISLDQTPDVTTATAVVLRITTNSSRVDFTGSISGGGTANQKALFDLPKVKTDTLDPGSGREWEVQITLANGHEFTPRRGEAVIVKQIA